MYGFWKNKRIVLYDTLLSGEEKEKVIALCKEAAETDPDEKDKVGHFCFNLKSFKFIILH